MREYLIALLTSIAALPPIVAALALYAGMLSFAYMAWRDRCARREAEAYAAYLEDELEERTAR